MLCANARRVMRAGEHLGTRGWFAEGSSPRHPRRGEQSAVNADLADPPRGSGTGPQVMQPRAVHLRLEAITIDSHGASLTRVYQAVYGAKGATAVG